MLVNSLPKMTAKGEAMWQARRFIHNIFSKQRSIDRTQKSFCPQQFQIVGAFLKQHSINPIPANYALAFNFCILKDTDLLPAIGELIKTGYALDSARVSTATDVLEQELLELANSTQDQLSQIEQIVTHSRSDASEYGAALEGANTNFDSKDWVDSQTILTLCDLTRAMIAKTRAVETELRKRSKAIHGLACSLHDAKHKADTDALTGLSNRRAFERRLGGAVERAKLTGMPCALAICDIDHFKNINDRFGHQTGDRVIKIVATSLADHCGKSGHVFRFGGDEYVILFEGLECEKSFECIDNARNALEQRSLVHLDSKTPIGTVSFSGGISMLGAGDDPSALLGNADRALYQSKSQGRNCVRLA